MAERIKITKAAVTGLPLPDKGDVIYRDSDLTGFGLRLYASGVRAYFVERKVAGRVVRAVVGRHGEITPAEAREKAASMLARMRQGADPVRDKKAEHKPVAAVPTFNVVARAYIAERLAPGHIKQSTAEFYEEDLEKRLADLAPLPINEVTRNHIKAVHQKLTAAGPTTANRAMRFCRAVFNYAVDNDDYVDAEGEPLLLANPCDVLKKKRLWNATRRKKGYVRPDELGAWVDAVLTLDPLRFDAERVDVVSSWLLVMACLGFRPGEAGRLTAAGWNARRQVLTLGDAKNVHTADEVEFWIPVGWRIARLLNARAAAGKALLFPTPKGKPLTDPRRLQWDVQERSGLDFDLHDLRRTFASILSALSPAPSDYQIKRLLNHTPDKADVTTEYVQHDEETLRGFVQRVEDVVFGAMTSARPAKV